LSVAKISVAQSSLNQLILKEMGSVETFFVQMFLQHGFTEFLLEVSGNEG